MRILITILTFLIVGCGSNSSQPKQSLAEARKGFTTTVVKSGDFVGVPDTPTGTEFVKITYESPVGRLAAYLTSDPGDGKKHPAIIWITGGDNNSIGDVWTPQNRSNDQSVSAFRKAGVIMMFPSQRGGNDNPGKREGFYGEIDDILSATDHLVKIHYVDPNQIYLGGHSTGGTLAMLVGEYTDRYRAVFSFGPVARVDQYGGDYVYCDIKNQKEIMLRSPLYWLHGVKSTMYIFEGAENGNWDVIELMMKKNLNPKIQFFKVPGHDHFSVLAPVTEKLAEQIIKGQVNITQRIVQELK